MDNLRLVAEIPAYKFRGIKALAALEGKTMKDKIIELVDAELVRAELAKKTKQLPEAKSC